MSSVWEMMVTFIYKATVVRRVGHYDKVYLYTDLPEAVRSSVSNLTLEFPASYGTGDAYVKEQFGVDAEVIDVDKLRRASQQLKAVDEYKVAEKRIKKTSESFRRV